MMSETARMIAGTLAARGESLAVAEASTGGLILSTLTDVPGASAWLRGGVVAYANESKREVIGVPAAILAAHGAASAETALAMARGVRRLFGATWGIAETGIAGPRTRRRSAKPAGLTFLAISGWSRGALTEDGERLLLAEPGGRAALKRVFAEEALALLLRHLNQTALLAESNSTY